jgi:hypothetical protein
MDTNSQSYLNFKISCITHNMAPLRTRNDLYHTKLLKNLI